MRLARYSGLGRRFGAVDGANRNDHAKVPSYRLSLTAVATHTTAHVVSGLLKKHIVVDGGAGAAKLAVVIADQSR